AAEAEGPGEMPADGGVVVIGDELLAPGVEAEVDHRQPAAAVHDEDGAVVAYPAVVDGDLENVDVVGSAAPDDFLNSAGVRDHGDRLEPGDSPDDLRVLVLGRLPVLPPD